MSTLQVPITTELDDFLAKEVAAGGYANAGEYVQALLCREKDAVTLRELLLEGARSPLSSTVADDAYFEGLRARAREWAAGTGSSAEPTY